MGKHVVGAMVATGALVGASLVVLLAGPAAATTISVATAAEYRNALTTLSSDASGPHTINITADITLDNLGEPTYTGTQPLTLVGNGHTIDANGATTNNRVLFELTNPALSVQDLTATGGNALTGGGGAIASGGPVILTDSRVSGNTAAASGGGILAASVTLSNSTVSGNTAKLTGGGIAASSATLTNSTVSGNTAGTVGGGISAPSVTLTNSTVSGNDANPTGGGISASSATLTNSTVSGNTAVAFGGGLSTGTTTLVYATVAGNSAPTAANIGASADTLVPFGSVIAVPQGGGANCVVDLTTSNGYNFSDDTSCELSGTGDRQNAGDPGLGALANNGGPTQTRLPQTGSPLIDAIPNASCQADGASGITADQRGVSRPQGAGCDIGAVEVEVAAPPSPSPGAAVPVQAVIRFTG